MKKRTSDNWKVAVVALFFLFCIIAVVFVNTMDSTEVLSHYEIIQNTEGLTMKQFLAKRSITMNSDSPKADEVYSIILVSDRQLSRSSNQDALWIIGGQMNFLFTNDTKLCQK
jgi:hypothetical protein